MPEIRMSEARQAEIDAARVRVRAVVWAKRDGGLKEAALPPRVARLVNSAAVDEALTAHESATNDDLADLYRSGDDTAALALYARYCSLVEGMARVHGTSAAFDPDDAHQEAVLALLESARASSVEEFGRRVKNDVRSRVADESTRQQRPMQVSRRVWNRVRDLMATAHDNVEAAASLAASNPDPHERMSREAFLAAYHAIHGGLANLDDAANLADPSAAAALSAVESGADAIDTAIEQAGLTDREEQIVRALTDCYGQVPTQAHVAAQLGISQQAVAKTLAHARTKLADAISR